MKTRTTPIATTKTQALARVLTSVTHGYTRVCTDNSPFLTKVLSGQHILLAGDIDGVTATP